jgi:hypothetical protein
MGGHGKNKIGSAAAYRHSGRIVKLLGTSARIAQNVAMTLLSLRRTEVIAWIGLVLLFAGFAVHEAQPFWSRCCMAGTPRPISSPIGLLPASRISSAQDRFMMRMR